jgi:type IV pilus assembly protein PilB
MDLIEKLIEEGFLDENKASFVEQEVEETEKTKEEILLEQGIISEEELFKLKSSVIGVPLKTEIDIDNIPQNILQIIHKESVSHYNMVPIGETDDTIEIGMVYPENLRAQEALKFISRRENQPYRIYLITPTVFKEISKKYKTDGEEIKSPLLEKLIKERFLDEETAVSIENEAENKNKSIEELLLEENIIPEEELFGFKSEVINFTFREDVDIEGIPSDGLNLIQEDSTNHYKMIPIGKAGDIIEIGMVYPENIRAQEALKFISRQNIFSYQVYLISISTFEKVLRKYQAVNKEFGSVLLEKLVENNFIEKEQALFVEKEIEKKNKTREEILLEENIISEKDLFNQKSEIISVSLRKEVDAEDIPEDLFRLFPKSAVDYYKMIPIGRDGEIVEIGMVYPENVRAKEALDLVAEQEKISYQVYLLSLSEFKKISKKIKILNRDFGSNLLGRLIEKGFLDTEKAKTIEQEVTKGNKIKEEILLEEKIISESELFQIKSEVVNLPFRDDVDVEKISEDLLRLIPEDSANYYKMAAIGKEEDIVEIGMVTPENLRAQEALKFLSRRDNFSHKIYLISLSTFEEISKQYRTLTKEVGEALEDFNLDTMEEEEPILEVEKDVGKLAEEAPIVKVVGVILRNAIEGGASDIHIEPTRDKLKVRFRVDGKLYSSLHLPMGVHLATVARVKILAGLKIDEQRLPQDGRFSTKMGNKSIDFRVSTFPTTLGEKVVIRVLDPTQGLKSINELGIIGRNFEILNHSVNKPTGMTLVTGPTGSGKTTTLYAVLKTLNKEGVNIVTLEDPVEYFMDGVNQSQTHAEIGYVFSKGLRQILRQDPDIIMVGEIRDDETADIAIHAALTGHVVLSTLHTNNAFGVIPRLIDMGIKPFLIPSALNTMMSQRLVRKLCDKCKEQITPSKEVEKIVMDELEKIHPDVLAELNIPNPLKVYTAKGCKYCSEEGYEGRTGIYEMLTMTPELGEIVMKGSNMKDFQEEAKRQKMVTMKQDGMIKAILGETTVEEVLRATEEK